MNIKRLTEEQINEAIDTALKYRHYFHQYPELSGEEYQTSETIQNFLYEEKIEYTTGFAGTGILAIIKGDRPGKTIALRADIDALPIEEKPSPSYRSKKKKVMHACGHDAHTAMLMSTASLLQKNKKELEGTVLCVFQPAEEQAPTGGAAKMLEDGLFEVYQPDAVLAQHVWPDLPVGKFGVMSGPIMGNSDRFEIIIKGAGGHASMPHQTKDSIVAAGQLIGQIQSIISRNINPLDAAVVTVGTVRGGERYNVIASETTLEGTVRTFEDGVKERVKTKLGQLLTGIEASFEVICQIKYFDGYPATINTPVWAEHARETARRLYGEESLPQVEPSLGGEDFARFLEKYPGNYHWLGTAIPERTVQKPLHDPSFDIDERALGYGIEFMYHEAVEGLKLLKDEE
ncbi:amidohydrolase [Marinococcus luteus]|uniref:Amidohydrolase n=1 Tax=Marinococcus luteus TaxID=1122204 RepID=A0A1H2XPN9_9BACI|nr:M20 family metallopeptidase [Marinococcus luteus]SDW94872.1 amidohydrolase [Marinococcus luteus]